jgi:GntR family transcriptional regulator, transcriptional repressor for pyruvate dehydrogenase complex
MNFPPLNHSPRLSDRVAEALRERIGSGTLNISDQLPSENAMADEFGVSRAVVREAVSRLKSEGLLYARQGKGIFVAPTARIRPLRIAPEAARSLQSVLGIVELRRALEAEAAALAAERRTAADLAALRSALKDLDAAVRAGGDGVEEDVAFHRLIAKISGNPYYLDVLEYIGQFLRGATMVMRANEATRIDFARQAKAEHGTVIDAIAAKDPDGARVAAARHMENAASRIRQADPAFWNEQDPLLDQVLRPRLRSRRSAGRPAAPREA